MPSPTAWTHATEDVPPLDAGNTVTVERYVLHESDTQEKTVARIDESPDGSWSRKIHFEDGDCLRKSKQGGKWGWVVQGELSSYKKAWPLRSLRPRTA